MSKKLKMTLHFPISLQVIQELPVTPWLHLSCPGLSYWPVNNKGGDGKKGKSSLVDAQAPVQTYAQ